MRILNERNDESVSPAATSLFSQSLASYKISHL